jgi:predicted transcriptional regulator
MCGEIKLWCWVQDDEFDEDHVFEVWIKLSDTIFKLKQEIRRVKPSLEHIDPESLKLWKVRDLY